MNELEPRLFGYIWRHSKRDQLLICGVVVASLPFYFASLDLPRRIVNDAIMGKAFAHGENTASFLEFTIHRPAWLGGGVLHAFDGFQLDRLTLLLGLSGLFLLLVLINGAFKYWINLAKGALGERMLRRLRFQLFTLMLRFSRRLSGRSSPPRPPPSSRTRSSRSAPSSAMPSWCRPSSAPRRRRPWSSS